MARQATVVACLCIGILLALIVFSDAKVRKPKEGMSDKVAEQPTPGSDSSSCTPSDGSSDPAAGGMDPTAMMGGAGGGDGSDGSGGGDPSAALGSMDPSSMGLDSLMGGGGDDGKKKKKKDKGNSGKDSMESMKDAMKPKPCPAKPAAAEQPASPPSKWDEMTSKIKDSIRAKGPQRPGSSRPSAQKPSSSGPRFM